MYLDVSVPNFYFHGYYKAFQAEHFQGDVL